MRFPKKLIVVALAAALPCMGAHAQSTAELKKEIEVLRAQLQALTQKIEAISAQPDTTALMQQVNRLEQKQDLAADDKDKSGFGGLKVSGTIEASYRSDDLGKDHVFGAGSGYTDSGAGVGMIQFTKESQDGEGIDWTLRLLPGSTSYAVHEASLSIPLNKENRIIAGLIPDFQGYEYSFPNANPTLGNQLISHNALYDLAGASFYSGVGMSHTFKNGMYAFKWLLGNIDPGSDDPAVTAAANTTKKSVGMAFRGDWYLDEYTYVGLSGAAAANNRNFSIMAIDGGYSHGNWQFNGQLSAGTMRAAAANGLDANWAGVSGLVGYKVVPRLQLLARLDYMDNRSNGGGTYVDFQGGGGYGLGPEKDSLGNTEMDPNTGLATTGANLTRLTLGTNYQINANTQWKTEIRLDQSSGYNFTDADGNLTKTRTSFGTAFVLSF